MASESVASTPSVHADIRKANAISVMVIDLQSFSERIGGIQATLKLIHLFNRKEDFR